MAHSIKKTKRRSSKKKINKRNKVTKSKRRSNKYLGGIKEYVDTSVDDTTKLLDHYLVKRIVPTFTNNLLQQDYNTLQITNKDLLIVIDMQNDFVDKPVECNGEQQLTGPEIPGLGKLGAFCVNNGGTIIQPIIDFAKKCNTAGGNVVFTRDVHTCDHCSFKESACPSSIGAKLDGVFPPHCVNGTVGSGLVKEIKDYLSDKTISDTINDNDEGKNDSDKGKISVVFKGCDQATDSFGAIAYPENDLYSIDRQIACKPKTLEKTGAFYANSGYTDKSVVKDGFDAVANVKFDKRFTIPESITNIYIVGLAGDFCVCDTAINLKKQYPSKNVSIIYELTRNAFIPFIKPNDPTLAAATLAEVKKIYPNDPNDPNKPKKLDHYAFKVDATGTRSLLPDEISALTVENLETCFHFLTDIEELFTRYDANGVKVIVNPTTIEKASAAIEKASAAIEKASAAIN